MNQAPTTQVAIAVEPCGPSRPAPLTCLLIGGTSLLQKCAGILQRRGHIILGIVAQEPLSSAFRHFDTLRLARKALPQPPDLLFSIVNRELLNAEELAWPTLAAINYHDSPLPRYAGVNAASWAIFNGETRHGVTWHGMTLEVDGGNIYVQRCFALEPDETALSLNAKCYVNALLSFECLLDQLERGDCRGTPQDISRRSVYLSRHRLPGNGILSWLQPSDAICRTVRSGHLGPYANDFGIGKILLPDGSLLLVGTASPAASSNSRPGTVIGASGDTITVATADGAVLLAGLISPDGCALAETTGLVGTLLPDLCDADMSEIEASDRRAAAAEQGWIAYLQRLAPPLHHPLMKPDKYANFRGQEYTFDLPLRAGCSASETLALATLCIAVEAKAAEFTVGLTRPVPLGFSPVLPATISLPQGPPGASLSALQEAIAESGKRPAFPLDLLCRFPALRTASQRLSQLGVILCCDASPYAGNPGIVLSIKAERFIIRLARDMVDRAGALALKQSIARALAAPGGAFRPHYGLRPIRVTHDLFAAQATRWPARLAVEMADDSITYGELELQANRLAAYLMRLGVGPEVRVGVMIPRSIDYVIALLGISKAGAAFVPLDATIPRERLADIVRDARPLLLVCTGPQLHSAQALGVTIVDLETQREAIAAMPPTVPPPHLTGDSLAYIIYTSGSSGRPKGSMIEHGALVRFITQDVAAHAIRPTDRILQLCSTTFDASLEEIFSALITGARLILRPTDLLRSAQYFLDFCESRKLSVIGIFPALLGDVLTEMERRGGFPRSVRLATTGGERVAMADAQRWQRFFQERRLDPPRLVNVYGLTETTIANLLCDLSGPVLDGNEVPIGRPIPGNLVRIVDKGLQPVPDGEVGELLLGGPQLARAYLNRPASNASRFVHDSTDGTRWFRTGDSVRKRADGNLVFVGRLDQQIKLLGLRIEPGEIEAALSSHPLVDRACVICREEIPGRKQLVAYWIGAAVQAPGLSAMALRSFLGKMLPGYMIPSMLVRLDAFPLTPNGKVDRDQLPAPSLCDGPDGTTNQPPRSPLERQLLEAWQVALGRSDFGIHENFFLLGGDSLSAVALVVGIESMIERQVSVADLFLAQTVANLASRLSITETPEPANQSVMPLQPLGHAAPLFAIHGAGGDIFGYLDLAQALAPDRPVYGVRAIGLDGTGPRHSRVEQMAAHYADQIVACHPDGPYHLLGFSAGGWYAYAVAAELLRRGMTVGSLCLLDSWPAARAHLRPLMRSLMIRLGLRIRKELQRGSGGSKSPPPLRMAAPTADCPPPGNTEVEYFLKVLSTYHPPRLPIHAHLFSTLIAPELKSSFWRYYARKGVTTHLLFSDHDDFLRAENMQELANRLRCLLEGA